MLNDNVTQIKVDLMKKKDMKLYPHLFPSPNQNYFKKQVKINEIYNSMILKEY